MQLLLAGGNHSVRRKVFYQTSFSIRNLMQTQSLLNFPQFIVHLCHAYL